MKNSNHSTIAAVIQQPYLLVIELKEKPHIPSIYASHECSVSSSKNQENLITDGIQSNPVVKEEVQITLLMQTSFIGH